MRVRSWLAVALASHLVSAGATASAQEPSAAQTALARRLFHEGMASARAERWAEAHEQFARSYELVRRPRILVNLGTAQVQTGRLVQAAESYRRFLREVTRGRDAAHRQTVEAALSELEPRLAHVRLSVAGLEYTDRVEMDGQEIAHAAVGVEMPANPTAHRFTVTRDGAVVAEAEVELAEGERREVALDARSLSPAAAAASEAPSTFVGDNPYAAKYTGEDASGSVLGSPWLWLGVGAAVVAGAVVAVVLATSGGTTETGNFGTGRWTVD